MYKRSMFKKVFYVAVNDEGMLVGELENPIMSMFGYGENPEIRGTLGKMLFSCHDFKPTHEVSEKDIMELFKNEYQDLMEE